MIANPSYNEAMVSKSKAIVRRQSLAWRKQLSPEEVSERSQTIMARTIRIIPWEDVHLVHIYVPIETMHEVDTWPLLQYIWRNQPDCSVAVPVLHKGSMRAKIVTAQTVWRTAVHGTQEPAAGQLLPTSQQYNLIIVPTLGFTDSGYRLGYGGGYYDKFLATQSQALIIGLCYAENLVTFEPEAHDIPLDRIITGKKIYKLS
jgi:5-formyltetrahydrofolate cyclo-ligase